MATSKHETTLPTTVYAYSTNIYASSTPIICHLPLLSCSGNITATNTFDSVHRSPLSPPIAPSLNHYCTANKLGWMYFCTSKGSLTVQDWLKNLRLHKYSETFRGKSFHEVKNSNFEIILETMNIKFNFI